MNLHEYQAKQLFVRYGLPVPKGITANTVDEALLSVSTLNSGSWVVKAQIHGGGRGKAGGVKVVKNKQALEEAIRGLLNTRLVTYQTTEKGQPVNEVLIEETVEIERELYLGALVDRTSQRVVVMGSEAGGVDIEKVAAESPEKIFKIEVDPLLNLMPYQCRILGSKLHLKETHIKQLSKILTGLNKMLIERDLSLVEINPLVVTKAENLLCLDAKVIVDDNALFRQASLREMRDASQEEPRELLARKWELNYVSLQGDIACMVNGAGLAMATMDLIKLEGGEPANFLDVGGGATEERVKEAFKIILSDTHVKAVLVNIFGGIVRCDLIAQGIINAVHEVGIQVPVVVRLQGNRASEANQLLDNSGLNIIAATGFKEAATQVVKVARGGKS